MVFKIGPGIGLASMRREGASILCLLIIWESIAKIIVLGWISAGLWVIFGRKDINRCS